GQILAFFLKNKNRIISVDELCNNVWEYETTPSIATVRTYIKNLRKILDSDMIVTIKGFGYKFES
ncbi:MAG: helix-turn-helix domain-containing protein, partial [Campylobacterota bacterium]|nr:helix-turn-helix domain-containing protein [Campylobacterota bacterium]